MATENMVKAGRAGLTFGGDWDETVEYNRLVGVRYDNKLFFSKKTVPVGTIPEDGEYWFLAYEGLTDAEWESVLNGTQRVGDSEKLGGKDASEYALDEDLANYLPLSAKPSGTYTGNGSATSRTIDIGGVGGTLMLYSSYNGISFVTKYGAVCIGTDETVILPKEECKFLNGVLTIATTSKYVNENTRIFAYEVL